MAGIKNFLKQLPHIYRSFTAQIKNLCKRKGVVGFLSLRYLPFLLLFFYFLFSLLYPETPLEKIKTALFIDPENAQNHLRLSSFYLKNNDHSGAKKEAKIAQTKSPNDLLIKRYLENLNYQVSLPEKINRQYLYWRSTTEKLKNYPTGWLLRAYYAYQLKNVEDTHLSLKNLSVLDPNNRWLVPFERVIK